MVIQLDPASGTEAMARSQVYKMLAMACSRPPGGEFLGNLKQWLQALLGEPGLPWLTPEIRRHLLEAYSFLETDPATVLDRSQVEFTRLFRGVKRGFSPPPPYESLYRDGQERLYGDTTMAVWQDYRKHGLDLAREAAGEPPDHIGFEMEFMHMLCQQQAEAVASGDVDGSLRLAGAQSEFLESHLLTWVPRFCQELGQRDATGLYRGLAAFTSGWLTFDYQQNLAGHRQ